SSPGHRPTFSLVPVFLGDYKGNACHSFNVYEASAEYPLHPLNPRFYHYCDAYCAVNKINYIAIK
ncbi:MAG: hypothetical protein ABIX01_22560, partial [Chitinophagaceae bacterium]